MPNFKFDYIATLPGGKEVHYETYNSDGNCMKLHQLSSIAEKIVRQSGITQKRTNNPYKIKVKLELLYIDKGQLKRKHPVFVDVAPPLAKMDENDYKKEMKEIFGDLPFEFADFVRLKAYQNSHSDGYEAIIDTASDLAYDLTKAFEAYVKRISSN